MNFFVGHAVCCHWNGIVLFAVSHKTYFGQEIGFIGTTWIAFGGHFNWLTIIWLAETVHLFLLSNATERVTYAGFISFREGNLVIMMTQTISCLFKGDVLFFPCRLFVFLLFLDLHDDKTEGTIMLVMTGTGFFYYRRRKLMLCLGKFRFRFYFTVCISGTAACEMGWTRCALSVSCRQEYPVSGFEHGLNQT